MKRMIVLLGLTASGLTSCDVQRALECNKQAIEMSTCAIHQNVRAIEASNVAIAENRDKLQAISGEISE